MRIAVDTYYSQRRISPIGKFTAVSASFISGIEESIQDEICDAGFYAGIANEAPNETLKFIAWTISRTEFWHAELQQALLSEESLTPSTPPACPQATGNFAADVNTAIRG